MDWKIRQSVTSSGGEIVLESQKNFRIPQADVERFTKDLTDTIVGYKDSQGLILPSNYCTRPQNTQEIIDLLHFSFDVILGAWEEICNQSGKNIPLPKLRVLSDESNLTGFQRPHSPVYALDDETIYIDPAFFEFFKSYVYPDTEDFTFCYIMAHEVGHHIQKHFFGSAKVDYFHEGIMYSRTLESVMDLKVFSLLHHIKNTHQAAQIVELHADFLAGVAIHHANKINPFMHENDIREGLETALMVGDTMMQYRSVGEINTRTFEHGGSKERMIAFAYGLHTGDYKKFSIEDIVQLYHTKVVEKSSELVVDIFR